MNLPQLCSLPAPQILVHTGQMWKITKNFTNTSGLQRSKQKQTQLSPWSRCRTSVDSGLLFAKTLDYNEVKVKLWSPVGLEMHGQLCIKHEYS